MSKLTKKYPWLKKEITLKNWEWILAYLIGFILGNAIYDFLKWLFFK